MKNIKVFVMAMLLYIVNITFGHAQQRELSKFQSFTPTEAFYDFMSSELDTLVIDNLDSPWVFEPMTFEGVKNKVILIDNGVEINAKKNAFPRKTDALFKFIDCENITIRGNHSVIRMNKEEYLDGEWRHVIRLRGCKNFDISDITLRDSGGDGIAVGRSNKVWHSQNIRLTNLQCINNKRQGISITSAENVWVTDSCFSDTVGTAPGAGVDLEPNVLEERIVNVNFKNCVFKNNFFAGITLSLGKLTSKSMPVSIVFENCLITNNFSIENTRIPAEIVIRSNKVDPVKGKVLFKKCTIENSQWSMLYTRKNEAGFHVDFKNCIARDVCNNSSCNEVIYMEVPHYTENANFGGYNFENLKMVYSTEKPPILVRGSKRNPLNTFKNVNGTIFLKNPYHTVLPKIDYVSYLPIVHKKVNLEIQKLKN